jgi:hypothetical protein
MCALGYVTREVHCASELAIAKVHTGEVGGKCLTHRVRSGRS